ncbi:MAG: hypothetical protein AMJ89_00415 [candidate division Zixibacteria bacterium SM23_73]|nr:MAG: hypothetical protein AMJ89_00415 [candidate division Zixibacteria bacterium SM23_73]
MKFKILSGVFVFVFIFTIFAAGEDSLKAKTEMRITGTGFKRLVQTGRYTEEGLISIFEQHNRNLETWFSEGKFCEIGKYFGKKGVIWTDEGAFEGVDKIGDYFKNLEGAEITFITKHVVIMELTAELNKPGLRSDKDIVDIIYVYIDFSFNSPGGGSGVAQRYHPRRCDMD